MNWTSRYSLKYVEFDLCRSLVNKLSRCFDGFKYRIFIIGHSAQQFNMHYHFVISDTTIGDVQSYDDS